MRFWKPKKLPPEARWACVAAAYLDSPRLVTACEAFVSSLAAQTVPPAELVIVHDGPVPDSLDSHPGLWGRDALSQYWEGEPCILETEKRLKQFGHPHRRPYALSHTTAPYLVFTNADNLYAPVFGEALLDACVNGRNELVWCDLVRSHLLWQPFATKMKAGHVDVGCCMVARRVVEAVPWTDFGFRGDGLWLEACAKMARKTTHVPMTLFYHH